MDVECPRCANLLPEPPGYGNYKCNHCGFFLKGMKNIHPHHGGFPGNNPELEWENEKILRYLATDLMNNSSKTSSRGNRDAFFDGYGSNSQGSGRSRLEMDAFYRENGGDLEYRVPLKDPIYHPSAHDGQGINRVYGHGSHGWSLERGFGDNSPQLEEFARSTRSRAEMRRQDVEGDVEGDRLERNSRNPRLIREQQRPLGYGYVDERPSYYEPPSSFGHGKPVNFYEDMPRAHRGLEEERADLLRQLENLKTRIARTYDMPHLTGREVPLDRNSASMDHYRGRAGVSYNHPDVVPAYEKWVQSPPYMNPSHDHIPFPSNYDMETQNYYQGPRHPASTFHEHEEPVRPQMRRGPANYAAKASSYGSISEDNWDTEQDHKVPKRANQAVNSVATLDDLEPQPQVRRPSNNNSDRSSHGSGSFPPERLVDTSRNKKHYHPILSAGTSDNLEPRAQVRTPTDYSSDHSSHGSRSHPPERMVVSTENKTHYHPILGGAPFISCLDCFELLKLPKELSIKEKSRLKLRCGACSSAILIEVKNRGLITSMWKKQPFEANKGPFDMPNQDTSASRRSSDASETKSDGVVDTKEADSSQDGSSNNIEHEESEDDHILEDHQANVSESNNRQVINSSSSSSFSSTAEDSQSHVIIQRNILASMELPLKETKAQTEADSPLCQQFDSFDISEAEPEEQNIGYDKNYENASLKKSSSINGSFNDVSEPTEVSVSLGEYPNTNVSNDSMEVSKEENQLKTGKETKSYFGGLFKKSVGGILEPNQVAEKERPKVTVNGHPISDDELRRAKMVAGPIQPGDYWYDYRAGFWGVMNLPCLGIIPPSIEEFKYSMPPNCAAGNTGVFVNGRELNKRDLNLLAGRGLPTAADKFYTVGISGKVLDEETGEQLYDLGRLAPTVERAKHGFGMRVPRIS